MASSAGLELLVELAFEPLDLERPAEPIRDSLRQRDVEAAVGLAALMHGKRRQIFVETNFQRVVGARARPSADLRRIAAATQRPSSSWFPPARNDRPRDRRSRRSLRRSPHGGILPFLPCFTVGENRACRPGNHAGRRDGAGVHHVGAMAVRAFLRVGRLALVDLCLIAAGIVVCARPGRHRRQAGTATAAKDAAVRLDILSCHRAIRDQFLTAKTHNDPPVGTLASRSSPENSE